MESDEKAEISTKNRKTVKPYLTPSNHFDGLDPYGDFKIVKPDVDSLFYMIENIIFIWYSQNFCHELTIFNVPAKTFEYDQNKQLFYCYVYLSNIISPENFYFKCRQRNNMPSINTEVYEPLEKDPLLPTDRVRNDTQECSHIKHKRNKYYFMCLRDLRKSQMNAMKLFEQKSSRTKGIINAKPNGLVGFFVKVWNDKKLLQFPVSTFLNYFFFPRP